MEAKWTNGDLDKKAIARLWYRERCRAYPVAVVVAVLLITVSSGMAQELDPETKARVEKAEKGPDTINISKYPAALQSAYQLFSEKCTQCHKLSRPINSEFALPDEWERYVKRMMRKPDSGISAAEAKTIYEFLVYDSSVRKGPLVEQKLSALSEDERRTTLGRLNKVKQSYTP